MKKITLSFIALSSLILLTSQALVASSSNKNAQILNCMSEKYTTDDVNGDKKTFVVVTAAVEQPLGPNRQLVCWEREGNAPGGHVNPEARKKLNVTGTLSISNRMHVFRTEFSPDRLPATREIGCTDFSADSSVYDPKELGSCTVTLK